jgi:hypothetical protein
MLTVLFTADWVEFVGENHTPAAPHQEVAMKELHQRCAGLDVHKDNVVACVRTTRCGALQR